MQGWRISMEDSHATILDLLQLDTGTPTAKDKKLSFFGVYDGHGGERVALFAGDNVHKIIAKQDAFAKGDFEQALKDGFLATDRAILNGNESPLLSDSVLLISMIRSQVRRRSIWLHCISRSYFRHQDLCCK
jgi:protein phosphatase PTC2/3